MLIISHFQYEPNNGKVLRKTFSELLQIPEKLVFFSKKKKTFSAKNILHQKIFYVETNGGFVPLPKDEVQQKLEESNVKYKKTMDRKQREKVFKEGYIVMFYLRKDRFLGKCITTSRTRNMILISLFGRSTIIHMLSTCRMIWLSLQLSMFLICSSAILRMMITQEPGPFNQGMLMLKFSFALFNFSCFPNNFKISYFLDFS